MLHEQPQQHYLVERSGRCQDLLRHHWPEAQIISEMDEFASAVDRLLREWQAEHAEGLRVMILIGSDCQDVSGGKSTEKGGFLGPRSISFWSAWTVLYRISTGLRRQDRMQVVAEMVASMRQSDRILWEDALHLAIAETDAGDVTPCARHRLFAINAILSNEVIPARRLVISQYTRGFQPRLLRGNVLPTIMKAREGSGEPLGYSAHCYVPSYLLYHPDVDVEVLFREVRDRHGIALTNMLYHIPPRWAQWDEPRFLRLSDKIMRDASLAAQVQPPCIADRICLQGFPENYFDCILSEPRAVADMLGNAWCFWQVAPLMAYLGSSGQAFQPPPKLKKPWDLAKELRRYAACLNLPDPIGDEFPHKHLLQPFLRLLAEHQMGPLSESSRIPSQRVPAQGLEEDAESEFPDDDSVNSELLIAAVEAAEASLASDGRSHSSDHR